ncbi:MAG: hypothetical protein CME93_08845 [Hyphomonadaceae bacterium]|nr:hypothetical protein [Hyphomonadaceae bacterium]OUX92797.1 MAG: hypothetical protein CBB77_11140 [Hyphomonas sp. TMED17]CAI8379787.1 MAG: Uncharacterised protein [Hyphomonas sp. TMED17]
MAATMPFGIVFMRHVPDGTQTGAPDRAKISVYWLFLTSSGPLFSNLVKSPFDMHRGFDNQAS